MSGERLANYFLGAKNLPRRYNRVLVPMLCVAPGERETVVVADERKKVGFMSPSPNALGIPGAGDGWLTIGMMIRVLDRPARSNQTRLDRPIMGNQQNQFSDDELEQIRPFGQALGGRDGPSTKKWIAGQTFTKPITPKCVPPGGDDSGRKEAL
jgi:hypothetical protein